jgi:RND family efflux transporter MFP subunit
VIKSEDADTGQNVEQGQAVYHLDWSGDIDIACDAPESALNSLSVGQIAKVTLPALPGKTFEARVREVAPSADPQSRTWRVKLTLNASSPELRLGMTAQVQFDSARANDGSVPFRLPATALFHDGGKPAVWVVRPGTDKLVLRPVTVTNYGERTIDIVAGLHDGERVVMQGVHTVSAGEHVQPIAPLHPEDFAS